MSGKRNNISGLGPRRLRYGQTASLCFSDTWVNRNTLGDSGQASAFVQGFGGTSSRRRHLNDLTMAYQATDLRSRSSSLIEANGLPRRSSKRLSNTGPSSLSCRITSPWQSSFSTAFRTKTGGEGGNRTLTTLPSQDFKSCASTSSATPPLSVNMISQGSSVKGKDNRRVNVI